MSQHPTIPVPHRLEGKVALVTGAASGIGRSITERFTAEGAIVLAGDVDTSGLERLERDLGNAVMTGHCDVTDEDLLETFVAHGTAVFGGVDIVVANAGAGTYAKPTRPQVSSPSMKSSTHSRRMPHSTVTPTLMRLPQSQPFLPPTIQRS